MERQGWNEPAGCFNRAGGWVCHRDKQDAVGENHRKGETTAGDAETWAVKTGFEKGRTHPFPSLREDTWEIENTPHETSSLRTNCGLLSLPYFPSLKD